MELKNVHKDIRLAYENNFRDYLKVVPQLFYFNAFVVLGNGIEAKIGTITSKYKFFHAWKRLAEEDAGVVDMETLLKGTCTKKNLLDLFENYILFYDARREKELTRDAVRSAIYNFLYDDTKGLPSAYQVYEIEEKTDLVYMHVFDCYPYLPSPYYGVTLGSPDNLNLFI